MRGPNRVCGELVYVLVVQELVVGWKELEMVAVAEYEVPVLGPPEACWKNICYSGMMKPRDVE